MDKENNFLEKNSSVNVIIALPPPSDSSSALENSKAQPCNKLNPLPAKRRKRNRKKKRKIHETSATQGDIGAEVPSYSVLQANEPDVKDNIACSSGNSHQSLDDEKIPPNGETSCLTMKQKRKIEKRKLRSRRKKEARLSRKSDGKPEQVEDRIQAASTQASMGIFDFFPWPFKYWTEYSGHGGQERTRKLRTIGLALENHSSRGLLFPFGASKILHVTRGEARSFTSMSLGTFKGALRIEII
ncbi:hypothetical protein NL676_029148 [Syzygium grande]|nr:hypothetical protein NL676_029148 [Syzygium grande]